MQPSRTSSVMAEERALTQAIRKQAPHRLLRDAPPDQDVILPRIGVTFLDPNRPAGYLRLYPQDFLVEEVLESGEIVRFHAAGDFRDNEDRRTLWADLLKANITGPDAIRDLAELLNIPEDRIGFAGIKDAVAVTAQRVSLRGVTREQIDGLAHDRFFLRPVAYGSGVLSAGQLQGNRFTIHARLPQHADPAALANRLTQPFWNFFGPQRFGSRVLSHRLGQALLQGDVDGCLRQFFNEPGPFDVPLYRELREELGRAFGRWSDMLELAKHFPATMRYEIAVLEALAQDPRKTRAALVRIKDQVKLWVYAYGSYLANLRLTEMAEGRTPPTPTVALPFSPGGPLPEYADRMRADGTDQFLEQFNLYPFLQPSDRAIPTAMTATEVRAVETPQGVILRFTLGKGAYATSCLSHAIKLVEGTPVPSWVKDGTVDALAVLGEPTLAPLLERFASVLKRRDAMEEEEEE